MSSIISSFLIDPVVRQARRFSRPSIPSTDTPRSRQSSGRHHAHDGVATLPDELLPAAVTGEITRDTDQQDFMNGIRDGNMSTSISGQPLTWSPSTEHGGLDAELEVLEERRPEGVSALSRTSIHSSASQRDMNRLDEETPNPLYGVPERFRSTNTSFSNSMHSLVDAQEGSPRRTTGQDSVRSLAGSYNSRIGNGTLPEDDGMGALRKRIFEIREMEVSNPEKARLIHDLMTEQHNSSQTSLHAPHLHGPRSPSSLLTLDKPLIPNCTNYMMETYVDPPTPMSLSPPADPLNPYDVDERSLEPTFVPKRTTPISDTVSSREGGGHDPEDDEPPILGSGGTLVASVMMR
ncbi:MAG: hypothetical protein M1835_005487 [Candelina submexicana]|nr:MAG: hypothetical protein M1835_005487 [Candelina submexicana]